MLIENYYLGKLQFIQVVRVEIRVFTTFKPLKPHFPSQKKTF